MNWSWSKGEGMNNNTTQNQTQSWIFKKDKLNGENLTEHTNEQTKKRKKMPKLIKLDMKN